MNIASVALRSKNKVVIHATGENRTLCNINPENSLYMRYVITNMDVTCKKCLKVMDDHEQVSCP